MQNPTKPIVRVSCALIWKGGRLLACQRLPEQRLGGKWEFPGGKRESGESAQECLHRELKEELDIEVNILYSLPHVDKDLGNRIIRLEPFCCELANGSPVLQVHQALRWLDWQERLEPDWGPADAEIIAAIPLERWQFPWNRLTVIMPFYNEGKILRTTCEALLARGINLVAIDDGSSDEGAASIADLPLHLLRHPLNLGQGAALQTGMDYVKQSGLPADAIVTFDADGQHRIEDLLRLVPPVLWDEADVVMGSRFLTGGESSGMATGRRWLLKVATKVNWLLTGLSLTDAHNGLRAFNQKTLELIELEQPRMAHASEWLTAVRKLSLRYREVPVSIQYTTYSQRKGQSNLDALVILSDIVGKWLLRS